MKLASRPNDNMADCTVSTATCGRGRLAAALLVFTLLTASACIAATAAAGRQTDVRGHTHVRHKRTVSDFVEGLMNAVYYHMDPVPEPSTVVTRITHVPAPPSVYKYVPMQKLKLSKLRARQVAEPKVKQRYPKKFSIKTMEDSSATMLKNDLPWTLHPLPPPMPTAKSIKLEVDKSMPWALHPLPPPVKTKNYSDYYWPDNNNKHPKQVFGAKQPRKHNHFVSNHKYSSFKPVDYKPVDFKTMEYNAAEHKPIDYKPVVEPDDYNHHIEYNPIDYRHVDYKKIHYKHLNYKSPDYNIKTEYTKNEDEDQDIDTYHHEHHLHDDDDDDDDDHYDLVHRGSYQRHKSHHNDHSAETNDLPSSSPQPPATVEYVSHITIEPSIQIASYSETDMQGDGSSSSSVSHGDNKQKCQCTVNGHRHKRDLFATGGDKERGTVGNISMVAAKTDTVAAGQSTKNVYVAQNVGHATEVQIQKSHDITDQSMNDNPNRYVQQVRNMNTADQPAPRNRGVPDTTTTTFRDDSDRFKVDFGRDINVWDEPGKPTITNNNNNNKGRFVTTSSPLKSNYDDRDDGGAGVGDGKRGFDIDDFRNRLARKPNIEKGYHVTKSTVENTGRGVSFSVQTPFSVSSFTSNVHRNPEDRRSRFRYNNNNNNEPKTTTMLSSFPSEHASGPLDFERFGLQSAADDKNSGHLDTGHYSRGYDDDSGRSEGNRFSSGYSGNFGGGDNNDDRRGVDFMTGGRLSSQFTRDFGGDDDDDDDDDNREGRTKPPLFRYNNGKSSSDRFGGGTRTGGRLNGGRTSSDDSVLEYFQPVVLDFESKSKNDNNDFKLQFGNNNNNNKKNRDDGFNDDLLIFGGKTDSTGDITKFTKDRNPDPLRLPGRLHESNENLSRKLLFHPSTFDID